jgi:hypothetical protein
MISGIYKVGNIARTLLKFKITPTVNKIRSPLDFLLGIFLISILIFWTSLLSPSFFYITSSLIALLGFFNFINLLFFNKKKLLSIIEILKSKENLVFSFLFLLFLLANLSYITNADSLDYHLGYALNFLNGSYDPFPDWYNGRMATGGEKLNSIGLSLGAYQFCSFLQLFALINIFIIVKTKLKNNFFLKNALLISFISSPVFLFLGTSAKPQLMPIAFTSLSFFLVIKNLFSIGKFNQTEIFIAIAFSLIAITYKFSFLISNLFTFLLIIFLAFKSENIKKIIFCYMLCTLLIIFPIYLDKFYRYHSTIIEFATSPVSGFSPSLDYFVTSAKNFMENHFVFPFNVIIPDSFGSVSTVLGFGFVLAFSLLFFSATPMPLICFLLCFILSLAILGMQAGRFFLEPYMWTLMCFTTFKLKKRIGNIYIKSALFISRIQYMLVVLCIFPFSLLAIYSFSEVGRVFYLTHFVNGFNLKTWVDKTIPENNAILLDHRSKSLYQRSVISFEIFEFSKNMTDRDLSLDVLGAQLLKYNVKYFITTSKSSNLNEAMLCSDSVFSGPEKLLASTKNPLNSNYFDGYILKITPNVFISCLKEMK